MSSVVKGEIGEIVRAVRDRLLGSDASNEIVKILLFGSCARGQDRPDSDIDLLIVLRQDRWSVRDRIYELVTDLILEYEREISLKVLSLAEFQRLMERGTPFMQEIKRDGQIVYEHAL